MSTVLSPALVTGAAETGAGTGAGVLGVLGRRYGVAPPRPSTAAPWSRPSLRNGTVRQPVRQPASKTAARRRARPDRATSNPHIARRLYRCGDPSCRGSHSFAGFVIEQPFLALD